MQELLTHYFDSLIFDWVCHFSLSVRSYRLYWVLMSDRACPGRIMQTPWPCDLNDLVILYCVYKHLNATSYANLDFDRRSRSRHFP